MTEGGAVTQARVTKSASNVLDRAVLRAVEALTFEQPGRHKGEVVPVKMMVGVRLY